MMVTRTKRKQEGMGRHKGNWAPGIAYLPVLLIRWAIVPHKDWVTEHRQRQEVVENQMHQHHHHYHHHGYHHHSSHEETKVHTPTDVMDFLFGQ